MPIQLHLSLALLLLLTACSNQPLMPGGTLPPPSMTIVAPKEPPKPNAETVPPPPPGPANYFVWERLDEQWRSQLDLDAGTLELMSQPRYQTLRRRLGGLSRGLGNVRVAASPRMTPRER